MQTRLDFLTTSAGAATVLAASGAAPKPTPDAAIPAFKFDTAAFDAALETTATHRHLFASTKMDGGDVLGAMRGVFDAYATLGTAASDMRPVAVLYHGASICLGFDDTIWNQYFIPMHAKFPESITKDFDTVYKANARGNPCLHKTGDKDDSSVEGLVADAGARFFVCNHAARGVATMTAHALKMDPTTVYQAFASHLVPNTMLVPAGVWAVHAIQERRYTYLQTTL